MCFQVLQNNTDDKVWALEARVEEAEERVKELEKIGISSAELIDEAYGQKDKMQT